MRVSKGNWIRATAFEDSSCALWFMAVRSAGYL